MSLENKKDNALAFLDFDGTFLGFTNNTQNKPSDDLVRGFLDGLKEDPDRICFILSGRKEADLKMLFEQMLTKAKEEGIDISNLILCPENGRSMLLPSQNAEEGYIKKELISELSDVTRENLFNIALQEAKKTGEIEMKKLDSGNFYFNNKNSGETIFMYEPKANGASIHPKNDEGRALMRQLEDRVKTEKNIGDLPGIETIEQANGPLAVEQTKGGKKVFAETILNQGSEAVRFLTDKGINVSNPKSLEGRGDDVGDQTFLNYLRQKANQLAIPCLALGVCNHSKQDPEGRVPGQPIQPIASPLFLVDGEGHCLDLHRNKAKRELLLEQQDRLNELGILPQADGEFHIPVTVLDTGNSLSYVIQNPQAYNLEKLAASGNIDFPIVLVANAGIQSNLQNLIHVGINQPSVLIVDRKSGEMFKQGEPVSTSEEFNKSKFKIIANDSEARGQEAIASLSFTHALHSTASEKGLIEKNKALYDKEKLRCPAAFYHELKRKQEQDVSHSSGIDFGTPQAKKSESATRVVSDSQNSGMKQVNRGMRV